MKIETLNVNRRHKPKRDSKIYMLNAVWFKPAGGEQRYRDYMKAVAPLTLRVGGRKLKSFVTDREIIGEFDADLLFFIEYPDWQAFKNVANSAEYHRIAYLKKEAIEKSLLIRCTRPEHPFSG
ncbi:MAG: hypothetical protein ACI854_001036 [Arenicella sp.]